MPAVSHSFSHPLHLCWAAYDLLLLVSRRLDGLPERCHWGCNHAELSLVEQLAHAQAGTNTASQHSSCAQLPGDGLSGPGERACTCSSAVCSHDVIWADDIVISCTAVTASLWLVGTGESLAQHMRLITAQMQGHAPYLNREPAAGHKILL